MNRFLGSDVIQKFGDCTHLAFTSSAMSATSCCRPIVLSADVVLDGDFAVITNIVLL